jgi:hypothetical protein
MGVPLSGSGYSAEPEPVPVSAVPVSIPNAAYTPAPWRVDGLKVQDGWGAEEGEDRCELACLPHPTFDALEIYGKRQRDDYAEHEANARLIAAAPTLFEACALLDAYLYATAPNSNEAQIVRDALAAATGTAKTPTAAECEASQSGPKGNARNQSRS